MTTTVPPLFDVPVSFGQLSLGKTTGRIGIKIDRRQLALDKCDECLCGKRVSGKVVLGRKDDSPGQTSFIEGDQISVETTFDINGVRNTPDTFAMSLSFNLNSLELNEVHKFSKGEGRFIATASAEIPEDERLDDADDDEDQPSLFVEGPWKEAPLDDLFPGAILKSLKKAGLKTVGDLAAWSAADKRLIDIEGIGEAKAEQIEEIMERFWEENPQANEVDDWDDEEEEDEEAATGKEAAAGA